MRIKAVVAYDGTPFEGYQVQSHTDRTVAGMLTRAATRLGITSPIVASGRTDRGVHATGQVIHLDLPKHWQRNLPRLQEAFNRALYPAIQIRRIAPAADDFHARFDAIRRTYRYLVKQTLPSPFEASYCHYLPRLDREKIARSLALFEGEHDFVHFHKTGSEPTTTVRTLYRTQVIERGDYLILYLEANGFLRAQVRMMVASAIDVARGRIDAKSITAQLGGERLFAPVPVPARGLYLARVIYKA